MDRRTFFIILIAVLMCVGRVHAQLPPAPSPYIPQCAPPAYFTLQQILFMTAVDAIPFVVIIGLIALVGAVVRRVRSRLPDQLAISWNAVFGCLALLSLGGFFANHAQRLISLSALRWLPVPGVILALIAVITGMVARRNQRSHSGIALGIVVIVLFCGGLLLVGSAMFRPSFGCL
jgi:hypothetical protein